MIRLLTIDKQHVDEVKDWITKAIEADKKNGMMFHLAGDYALYAEFFKRKGHLSKVKQTLNMAIDILKECGAHRWVKRYEEEVASLS